ncbi:bifunctional hydroxymethylpyrimidine kinase/phosphomethylpyrimidine kinase [Rossellomorea marisflavi]|uniref:bifunctional hydroxymethylpyrimidine kinase/phosphomethylpyrimidine kinase n=1 Tax=Rossellomorea marisflavi TaxID=189381 RepID=UPI001EE198AC|nr:bifunctional hydroxymethylpyrimidine kinase/phosphomethylpyrimidine kinase [Rossellomorea marisflavi]UKS63595.1 bifunctional hydroxymethylpyrimidine kinase/phosphomethylpyrimidine kinase [Rossellomorea marisflavi]
MKKVLTIAGSDSGGGAGIQADLKTFQELGVFGMSAITAVTAQNTLGVHGIHPVPPCFVGEQMEAIATDLSPDAVKTGMLVDAEMISQVASSIKTLGWSRVVVDPVMVAKGGASLLQEEAVETLINELIPLSFVVTPNIPEAEKLTGIKIITEIDRQNAAKSIHSMGADHVIIKGGHLIDSSSEQVTDLLYDGDRFHRFTSRRSNTPHTHGTGCTFSAAVTAQLSKDQPVHEAVSLAKEFISSAIEHTLQFGNGHGPTNHQAFRKFTRTIE